MFPVFFLDLSEQFFWHPVLNIIACGGFTEIIEEGKDREYREPSLTQLCSKQKQNPVHKEMEEVGSSSWRQISGQMGIYSILFWNSHLPSSSLSASPKQTSLLCHCLTCWSAHGGSVTIRMQSTNSSLQSQFLYTIRLHMGLDGYRIFTLSHSLWETEGCTWHGLPDSLITNAGLRSTAHWAPLSLSLFWTRQFLKSQMGVLESRARHPRMVQIADHLNITAVGIPRTAGGWWHSTCSSQAAQWTMELLKTGQNNSRNSNARGKSWGLQCYSRLTFASSELCAVHRETSEGKNREPLIEISSL